jgi:hypothetical protein
VFTSRSCSTVEQGASEQKRAGQNHRQTLRAADSDVQPVWIEGEGHVARQILGRGTRH